MNSPNGQKCVTLKERTERLKVSGHQFSTESYPQNVEILG